MNEKAKKYLEICSEAEDAGTSEGVRKAWESRRRGGSAAGRWNDYSGAARRGAPAWNSDHFKAAREAYKAHSDHVDQLNAAHPGVMGGQMWSSEDIAKKNELSQKWRDEWSKATSGWTPRERVAFLRENGLNG